MSRDRGSSPLSSLLSSVVPETPQGSPEPEISSPNQEPFAVEILKARESSLEKYQPLGGIPYQSSESGSEEPHMNKPLQIVGEHGTGNDLHYYALFSNDVVRRFNPIHTKNSWPDLLDEYLTKKGMDELDDFDPWSTQVHPEDRPVKKALRQLRLIVHPPKPQAAPERSTSKSKRKSKKSYEPDESEDDDDDVADSDDFEDDMPVEEPTRRSSRIQVAPKRRYNEVEEDSPVKTRKSRRIGSNVVESDSDDFMAYESPAPKTKGKLVRKKRTVQPGYGVIRDVDELGVTDDEGDDAALRSHRKICEKCRLGPSHELLQKHRKSKKGKRAKTRDEFEMSDSEKFESLGGWVRCLKCCVVAHWKCVATDQRDQIIFAVRQNEDADGPKRKGINIEETTDFLCNHCSNGGICIDCKEPAIAPELLAKLRPGAANADAKVEEGGVQDQPMDIVKEEPKEATLGGGKDDPIALDDSDDDADAMEVDGELQKSVKPPSTQRSVTDPERSLNAEEPPKTPDITEGESELSGSPPPDPEKPQPVDQSRLLFRCITCKRPVHYEHLPTPFGMVDPSLEETAQYYQDDWQCHDCKNFADNDVDLIVAWRPYPADAPQPKDDDVVYTANLPREYLIKWQERGYNRCSWVPHMWLLSLAKAKLKNFTAHGTKVKLLERPIQDEDTKSRESSAFNIGDDGLADPETKPDLLEDYSGYQGPEPEAERRIPPAWKTVDVILDVYLWHPPQKKSKKPVKKSKKGSKRRVADSEDEDEEDEDEDEPEGMDERLFAYRDGVQPDDKYLETIAQYEKRTKRKLTVDDANRVIWAYIKWDELLYEEATWDAPPEENSTGWIRFLEAWQRFLFARTVHIPKRIPDSAIRASPEVEKKNFKALKSTPHLGQKDTYRLMDFQIEGVSWLLGNWCIDQHSILADEMGLGKTIQIAVFLGVLFKNRKAAPSLIVVPNSTITNWLRELARWAPNLRAVPFYGPAKSRKVIQNYELYHENPTNAEVGTKYHVMVTTYETVTSAAGAAAVFGKVPRWECLIVDEGQRLKSDSSLIFKKLSSLNSEHRIIMTGTPLNNNIRELFNLMNFLDPVNWQNLEELEKQHEELTHELVLELHEKLRPYFLRRLKAEVLNLPPKNEVIVPVSMTALQKQLYKSILQQNIGDINLLIQGSNAAAKKKSVSKLNNVLMQLRKCLQHPYLIDQGLEPAGLSDAEAHKQLIDASAKLLLLKTMLPILKQRGHRVLLFSQFKIALDIIEDFITGEGYKFCRLDGDTPGADRQKGMDEYNKPNSDKFIYLLTTRAGGVGINLSTADTVIMFDPDFNPHQDLQAIARSYRYGLKKTCLVFKLMVRASAEERIIQTGKKKMALDHLIVQKMEDEEGPGENIQSILTFGAQALFAEDAESMATQNVVYSEQDILRLIEKTEVEGDDTAPKEKNMAFDFAKVWTADRETFEDVDDGEAAPTDDSWAVLLAKAEVAAKQQAIKEEVTGRGARRRATTRPTNYYDGSPEKQALVTSTHGSQDGSEDFDYANSVHASEIDSDGGDDTFAEPKNNLASPGKANKRSELIEGHTNHRNTAAATLVPQAPKGQAARTVPVVKPVKKSTAPPQPIKQSAAPPSKPSRTLSQTSSNATEPVTSSGAGNQNDMQLCRLCRKLHGHPCPSINQEEKLLELRRQIADSDSKKKHKV
ncbi:hypothetical protein SISNIDRAFT_325955 [Sistotremastrum niveocremeum HHB9708]|uniref:Chromatin remodeling factor mit1 n=1 Tax=Sistotremastrum niveocremeum HHB9708 TaxID=1314777 RepID=A0A164XAG3_9AGAM|nr:hypothetical protein SISNIDRAFT_325955 [Sistotremastrum niveocremeum HHB9708]